LNAPTGVSAQYPIHTFDRSEYGLPAQWYRLRRDSWSPAICAITKRWICNRVSSESEFSLEGSGYPQSLFNTFRRLIDLEIIRNVDRWAG
jgi:hypothetical protein